MRFHKQFFEEMSKISEKVDKVTADFRYEKGGAEHVQCWVWDNNGDVLTHCDVHTVQNKTYAQCIKEAVRDCALDMRMQ